LLVGSWLVVVVLFARSWRDKSMLLID